MGTSWKAAQRFWSLVLAGLFLLAVALLPGEAAAAARQPARLRGAGQAKVNSASAGTKTSTPTNVEGEGYSFNTETKALTVTSDAGTTAWRNNTNIDKTAVKALTISMVANIGESAFSGCTALTGVTIPAGVQKIGKSAFSGCTALKSVVLRPTKAPALGEGAFPNGVAFTVPEGASGYDAGGWEVLLPAAPLVITGHPQNASVQAGGQAVFSVTATGAAPLAYQWEMSQDNGITWSGVSGATSASYTINNATQAMSGRMYRCVVKSGTDEAASNAAVLTVTPASTTVPVTGVTLNETSLALYLEGTKTAQLTATVAPSNATDKIVVWTTSNAAIASVSQSGKVTAVSAGTATITAEAGGKSAACQVTVAEGSEPVPVNGLKIDPTTLTLYLGVKDVGVITATITPENASNKALTWESNTEGVATVANGKVTAVSEGSATITVTSHNRIAATCTVTVKPGSEAPATPTPQPTVTPKPTATPRPTATPKPTATPAYSSTSIRDEYTGVRVTGSLSASAKLDVREDSGLHGAGRCGACDEIRKQVDAGKVVALYDVTLTGGDPAFEGQLRVRLPVGSKYEDETMKIYHCDGGTLETRSDRVLGGAVETRARSLSPFAVVGKAGSGGGGANIPKTGDGASAFGWLLLALGTAGTALLHKRRGA